MTNVAMRHHDNVFPDVVYWPMQQVKRRFAHSLRLYVDSRLLRFGPPFQITVWVGGRAEWEMSR